MKSTRSLGNVDHLDARVAALKQEQARLEARAEELRRQLRGDAPLPPPEPTAIWQPEASPEELPAQPQKLRVEQQNELLLLMAWLLGLLVALIIVYNFVK